MHQQPGRGCRRERDRRLKLRVVIAARAFESMCPSMVEDIFALAVAFQVKRHGAGNPPLMHGDQVMRRPAGPGRGRSAFLERGEEAMREKRIEGAAAIAGLWRGAGIPVRSINLRDRIRDPDLDHRSAIHGTPPKPTLRMWAGAGMDQVSLAGIR